jgi:hypothetical protein
MNTRSSATTSVVIAGLLALCGHGTAEAVSISPSGLGQVLLFPYYTVRQVPVGSGFGAYNALLAVQNSTSVAKAVSVTFFEGRNGRMVFEMNLYLGPKDSWTAAIVPTTDGTGVFTTDKSCTAPSVSASFASPSPFVNDNYVGPSDDGAGTALDRTREGYVEVIEMGDVIGATATAITPVNGVPPCGPLIPSAVQADVVQGTGGLFGSMNLVNVLRGEDFAYEPVALTNFTSTALWFPPGDVRPNLSSVNPKISTVTSGGKTMSTDWSTSGNNVNAVSAVLMHDVHYNEFVLDASLKSGTDWVITFPTKSYYYSGKTVTGLFQRNFGTSGACDDTILTHSNEESSPLSAPQMVMPCWGANVLSFNASNVLGSTNRTVVTSSATSGWSGLSLGNAPTVPLTRHVLTGGSSMIFDHATGVTSAVPSTNFYGLPATGFAVISSDIGGATGSRLLATVPHFRADPPTAPSSAWIVANPYGQVTVTGASLSGNFISKFSGNATIQLGTTPGTPGSFAQIDVNGLNIGPGGMLTIVSGAAGQSVVLANTSGLASSVAGTIRAQGSSPPAMHIHDPYGITVSAAGAILSPAGLRLDTLGSSWNVGQPIVNAGIVDGGPNLELLASQVNGGGAFKGDTIAVRTFGNANNPLNGAFFLQNGLQLYPSSGNEVKLTLNGYSSRPQVFNLFVNGNATVWMPSSWPAGYAAPANNAVVQPGGSRGAGVPEPTNGGGSMILQATGMMTLYNGGTNDFVFPGAIVLKAVGNLNLNGVVVDQGWTTTGQAFQGIFFESPNIVSPNGNIRVYGNDLNWMNFSTFPQAYVRAFSLKRNPDTSASFVATDATTPHVNTYSVIQNTAASGGCWTCIINTQPVNMFGAP